MDEINFSSVFTNFLKSTVVESFYVSAVWFFNNLIDPDDDDVAFKNLLYIRDELKKKE